MENASLQGDVALTRALAGDLLHDQGAASPEDGKWMAPSPD